MRSTPTTDFQDNDRQVDLRPSELDEIIVSNVNGERIVTCFCGETVRRTIVPHLREIHDNRWRHWVALFGKLRSAGYPLKKVMRLFSSGNGQLLFSWTVVDRALRRAVERDGLSYKPPPTREITRWEPEGFVLPRNSVWDFPRRGDWAVHSGDYRGNWPPQLVRSLLLMFTEPGDLVVDAFVGGGTSLIEAWLLNRRSLGLDISKLALQTTQAKLDSLVTRPV